MRTTSLLLALAIGCASNKPQVAASAAATPPASTAKPRARALGIPLDGEPGPLNAITDVAGVTVGHETLIRGEGPLKVGQGPVRTGVTAVFPNGADPDATVFAGHYALNGNGEMTGTIWLEESGTLTGPVVITNTHSVGVVRDAVLEWMVKNQGASKYGGWSLPVVAETWDGIYPPWGGLNDINGFHVKKSHAFAAMDGARGGPVPEGNVGGGTGMICNEFKGGIGTSSRRVEVDGTTYMVGVLVQCNYGLRPWLRIAGVPVGREIPEPPCYAGEVPPGRSEPRCGDTVPLAPREEHGSIIVVVATDAPLLPHQLERIAQRVSLGLGRMGSAASNGSGDIFVAFSTATAVDEQKSRVPVEMINNQHLTPLFVATVEATEESVINAMLAAETMVGAEGYRVPALPHDRLLEVMKKYNRLEPR